MSLFVHYIVYIDFKIVIALHKDIFPFCESFLQTQTYLRTEKRFKVIYEKDK